jgi:hypothetical protein
VGQSRQILRHEGGLIVHRHCEERSDEAIQNGATALDCFALLAMTRSLYSGLSERTPGFARLFICYICIYKDGDRPANPGNPRSCIGATRLSKKRTCGLRSIRASAEAVDREAEHHGVDNCEIRVDRSGCARSRNRAQLSISQRVTLAEFFQPGLL